MSAVPYGASFSSPLNLATWEVGLLSIPDKQFTQFLLLGIANGFRIGLI
jgi:hypothetical protein